MEVRAGYKQTEVGVIPEEWASSKLGDFSYVTKLAGFEYTLHFDYSQSGPITAIRALNIKNGTLNLEDVHTVPKATSDKLPRSKLAKGDLVISYVGTLGRVAVIPEDDRFHLAPNVAKISVDMKQVAPDFLGQYLNSWRGQKLIFEAAASTTQAALSMSNLREIFFARPPLPEQRAIATALSDVDALLGGLDRLIAKKRDLKQAAMQQLLTGQTRLPGFHGEWEVKRLGDHVTFLRNGVNSRAELLPEGRVKYLHYGDIHASTDSFLSPQTLPSLPDAKAARLDRLRDGDVIFADASEDIAGVCKSVELRGTREIEVVSGLHTIAARFDKSVLADSFKGFLQHCPSFATHLRRLAAGTKVYATNRSHIASVEMRLPSVDEQTAIGAVLSDMGTELAALEARRDKTRALKQGMMQELLTGRTRLVWPEDSGAGAC
ncbi:MAG: restriction endonuclease subunit S [Gammaproteobacteria bacterium]